ncbi:MAG TPA: type I secretion C-terminal target domain-containing protein, partial [Rhodospirillales bacterium]
ETPPSVDHIDQVTDFSGNIDGDTLDISDLLAGLGANAGNVDTFFQAVIDADNTKVDLQIDVDGAVGGETWQTFAQVTSGDGLTGQDLLDDVNANTETGL